MEHIIPITNGKGSKELADGEYTVTASIAGYDILTLHVTDNGTDISIPVVGTTFHRCDSEGTTYGDVVTTDDSGNAVFNAVPYSTEGNAPTIYFKQITSDGEHTFSVDLQNTTLEEETKTVEIENPMAAERTFSITDANYEGLPITDGQITLTSE